MIWRLAAETAVIAVVMWISEFPKYGLFHIFECAMKPRAAYFTSLAVQAVFWIGILSLLQSRGSIQSLPVLTVVVRAVIALLLAQLLIKVAFPKRWARELSEATQQ